MDNSLPSYRCSRLVHAFKIGQVVADRNSGGVVLVPEDSTLPDHLVSVEYNVLNKPSPGGYYLIEGDDHESYKSSTEFESELIKDGYCRGD
jgi:hypothetical protein